VDSEARLPDLRAIYFRSGGDHELEGTPYHIDAVWGAAGFDDPGDGVRCGAKLASRLGRELRGQPEPGGGAAPRGFPGSILIHEPAQGHFPVWLWVRAPETPELRDLRDMRWVLSGRNILDLRAAADNMGKLVPGPDCAVTPAADILNGREALRGALPQNQGGFALIAAFPGGPDPRTSRLDALWEGLRGLTKPGGVNLVVLPSSEAERFDRKKPKGLIRLGDLKRRGFRALAYLYGEV
jgi:hypothetical protein